MAGLGATSCFPPFPLSHSSRPLSVIISWPLVTGSVSGAWWKWSVLWSCQARAEMPAQSDYLLAGCSAWTGASTNGLYFVFPLIAWWATEGDSERWKRAVSLPQGTCVGLKEGLAALWTIPSASPQPPAERARSPKFHSSCVGRAAPQLHQAGVAKEASHEKESPSHSHHRESSLMGKSRKTHSGQADVQEQQLQGKF